MLVSVFRRLVCGFVVVVALSGCGSDDNRPKGSATTTSTTTSLPATVGDSCLVGRWRAQQTVIHVGILSSLVGGESVLQTVADDGKVSVDYGTQSEWRGFSVDDPVTITKHGTELFHLNGSTGLYRVFDGDISNVFATQRFAVGQPLVIQLQFEESARTYTCDDTTLTIQNTDPDPPDVFLREG